jgi:hypothetical protein
MPDTAVACDTVGCLISGTLPHPACHLTVAMIAVVQGNLAVKRSDLNRFMETARCKGRTVIPAIDSFNRVLPDNILRCMTRVAARYTFVCGAVPRVVLIPHDVAIPARSGIVVKVGDPSGIEKSKTGDSRKNTENNGQYPFWQMKLYIPNY